MGSGSSIVPNTGVLTYVAICMPTRSGTKLTKHQGFWREARDLMRTQVSGIMDDCPKLDSRQAIPVCGVAGPGLRALQVESVLSDLVESKGEFAQTLLRSGEDGIADAGSDERERRLSNAARGAASFDQVGLQPRGIRHPQ